MGQEDSHVQLNIGRVRPFICIHSLLCTLALGDNQLDHTAFESRAFRKAKGQK